MNRLEVLRIFTAAAASHNFRDAAKKLGVSAQVVTRGIQCLEDELGEVLFHRNTRGVQLTNFGERFVIPAQQAISNVEGLFQHPNRRQLSEYVGVVKITAPPFLIRDVVMSTLSQRLADFPGLFLDFRLSEEWADTVNQQIDIGIRLGPLRDNRWIAKAVKKVPFYVAATPALLARIGTPKHIDELEKLPTTALLDRRTGRTWPWLFSQDRLLSPSRPVIVVDDLEAECAAVLSGMGIGQLSGIIATPYLRSGRLVAMLSDDMPNPWPLHVYRPQAGPVPARVRLVFDTLVEILGNIDLTLP
ncbi:MULTISPECIES: LysR family transcriptional regulator [Pectobacterium]|uniref:LysR family transcriptional regulator n=1 Tax=Pectobacterium aroidearum TaxID=1201031 RepID=A0AAW3SS28_9GAMM|nr:MULTISPECIES: LysR family transcriptional regulator [Pectobacterium]MBA5203861.1 LysR family transcriptional regulator [Pectobacterium aroidearum]MBA5236043.1 LysR family transcriptional regulator [Pectobacterium aroidearum]MBG0749882.1 HTH-type transcriptional regulator BudR [Pectobacterium carotovorum subsp. carotovorum PCCS1]QPI42595.1 LysR family transcriptional regulator [Pectobacterium aroidearum]UUE35914.1 LysR family transcriptional regulator [Pectobacterium aroidearum]